MALTRQLQVRTDTAANWTSENPTLAVGELGLESDTGKIKAGDGSTVWTSLAYLTYNISQLTDLWGQEFEAIADTNTSHNFANFGFTKNFHFTALTANRTVTVSNAVNGSQLFIDVDIASGETNHEILFSGVGTPKISSSWINGTSDGVILPGSPSEATSYTIAAWYNGTQWKINVIDF